MGSSVHLTTATQGPSATGDTRAAQRPGLACPGQHGGVQRCPSQHHHHFISLLDLRFIFSFYFFKQWIAKLLVLMAFTYLPPLVTFTMKFITVNKANKMCFEDLTQPKLLSPVPIQNKVLSVLP